VKVVFWSAVGLITGFSVGTALAQFTMGQTAGQAPAVTDVWQSLITSGPLAVVLGYILWRVDSERKQLQQERDALLERVLTGLNSSSTSLNSVAATNSSIATGLQSLNTGVEALTREVQDLRRDR